MQTPFNFTYRKLGESDVRREAKNAAVVDLARTDTLAYVASSVPAIWLAEQVGSA